MFSFFARPSKQLTEKVAEQERKIAKLTTILADQSIELVHLLEKLLAEKERHENELKEAIRDRVRLRFSMSHQINELKAQLARKEFDTLVDSVSFSDGLRGSRKTSSRSPIINDEPVDQSKAKRSADQSKSKRSADQMQDEPSARLPRACKRSKVN